MVQPPTASIRDTFGQAVSSFQQGGFSEAERLCELILARAPEHFDALHLTGVIALHTGRAARCADFIGRAVRVNPSFADAHNNLGIALAQLGRLDEALASWDAAIALDPAHAGAHGNRGNALRDLKRPKEAIASCDKAIALWPDGPEAHNNRGNALSDLHRFEEAIASYDRAIALNPRYPNAHGNRGGALSRLDRLDEAVASYDAAVALDPGYAEAHSNRGVALNRLGRLDTAIASYDKAIALRPDFADAHFNKSLALLEMGQFALGWSLFEWRKRKDEPVAGVSYPQPPWSGTESLAGRRVFLHWEQGFGDTLQFCRYAKLVQARGAQVVMSVQAPLARLLGRLHPGVEIIGEGDAPAAFDFHAALMSLPLAFATTLETIPSEPQYLTADPPLAERWAARLPPRTKPRIGLVWAGRPTHENDRNRSIDLGRLRPLLACDADWICLQKELRPGDAVMFDGPTRILHFGDELADFDDTAALIDQVDLVISVDTSVAHLAGALGKPVWILLPYHADWRWLVDRADSPWYPSARIYRQAKAGDWSSVIERMRIDLLAAGGA